MRKYNLSAIGAVALAAALLCPSLASAKNLCVESSFGNIYVFQKVKALKKPGKSSPLSGFWLSTTPLAYPVFGTAVVRGDSSVFVAVHSGSMNDAEGVAPFFATWTGDATLAGSGEYDNGADGIPDGLFSLIAVDCKTVTIP